METPEVTPKNAAREFVQTTLYHTYMMNDMDIDDIFHVFIGMCMGADEGSDIGNALKEIEKKVLFEMAGIIIH